MKITLFEFTKVQSLKTDSAIYNIGKSIEFWHPDKRDWLKGKIKEITQSQEFFISINITYFSFNRQKKYIFIGKIGCENH
ncbi:hypothetical protein WKK05_12160 [Nostoc sp. UHCC 0302]|uniref:hypothetical protein n=1 Tax=Nostoc sp. UHCC 0302 TaxID=3134896 RepID=UPI00311CC822